jgi:hypothetical protein
MFLLGSPLAHVVAFEAALHDEGRSARSRLPVRGKRLGVERELDPA